MVVPTFSKVPTVVTLKMKYIIDMQGFKQPGNDFVLKELAIVPFEEDAQPLIFLFKEPFPWKRLTDKYKRENTWLKK